MSKSQTSATLMLILSTKFTNEAKLKQEELKLTSKKLENEELRLRNEQRKLELEERKMQMIEAQFQRQANPFMAINQFEHGDHRNSTL